MAFFVRALRARYLKKKWLSYQEERELALNANEDESDLESPRESLLARIEGKFNTGQKRESALGSIVWKSFLGFLGGVLLTYIFFIFLHVGVNFSLRTTTCICGLAGVLLCLALAFSSNVRCYVLLLLPVFFSKQGRQALLAYALFLAFTGPARNTMHNMGILSDSMTCGQEMVKRTLRQITEMVKAPFKSIKESLQKVNSSVKDIIESVKSFLMNIKRLIRSILSVIKKGSAWLGSIINICNHKVGTPFHRCMRTFDDAIADCKAKLGVMDFLCHVVHIVKALCYTVKCLDFICIFTEFVSDKIVAHVRKKLREFSLHMKNLFYVSVEFSHHYEFETKAFNSTKDVAKTILQKFGKKMEKLQNIFSFFGFMFSFLFLLVFFKIYYYKYKYLSSDRFDNIYISKYIVELDLRRALLEKETVLPLEPREKRKYAKPTCLRLLEQEKSRMTASMFLLTLTTFKVITFLVLDYSLFWILLTIYDAGKDAVEDVESSKFGIHVEGEGILANFYRKLGNTLEVPVNPSMHLTPLHCLPDPVEPDIGRYLQIGFLVALTWILTLTEPYGLRLRNIVMSHYYPERAKERAVWLYNHILQSRASFVRFARRHLRRKFHGGIGDSAEKIYLTQRLFASFPILGTIFGRVKDNTCIVCEAAEARKEPLERCKTPDCRGRYCCRCFATLQKVCTICQHPVQYGDVSDISEEIDSSEDFYERARSTKSESSCKRSHSEDDRKFLTFKDMELRDRFRDVEANKTPDYAKLGDLHNSKKVLKKRVKEIVLSRLQRLEAEKKETIRKRETQMQRVRSKVQELINKLKKKKSEQMVGGKSALKKKSKEDVCESSDGQTKSSSSRVSFNLREDKRPKLPETKEDFVRLKEEVKAKIASLKERRRLSGATPSETNATKCRNGGPESAPPQRPTRKSSPSRGSDVSTEGKALSYCFVVRERDPDFYVPEQPDFL